MLDEMIMNYMGTLQPDTRAAYRKKIATFREYLLERKRMNNDNCKNIFKGLEHNDFIESMAFYVEQNNVKYRASTDIYYACVREFLKYISANYGCNNPNFENKSYDSMLKDKYDELIVKLKLNISEQVKPLTNKEVDKVISECNAILDYAEFEEISSGKWDGAYSRYISALLSKMVLCYGTSIKTLCQIGVQDYNSRYGTIVINGYKVHMPDGLKKNMDDYMQYRHMIKGSDNNPHLFIDFLTPNKKKMDCTKMFFILKELIGTYKSTALAKYAIIQLIRQGTPANLIKDFTGYKDIIYNHCQEIVDEDKGIVSNSEKCRKLDVSVRMSPVGDML